MESAEDLADWMVETGTPYELADAIQDYLEARGTKMMTDIVQDTGDPDLYCYAEEHDELGWSNFLEGRVGATLFLIQEESMKELGMKMTLTKWSGLLVQSLILITHRQWLYRNAQVHLKKAEGLTEREHMRVIEEVRQMMLVDPNELLPRHQHLLEEDFLRLGQGSTVNRKLWLDKMSAAVKAKRAVRGSLGQEGGEDNTDKRARSNRQQENNDNEAQSRCRHLWRHIEETEKRRLPPRKGEERVTRGSIPKVKHQTTCALVARDCGCSKRFLEKKGSALCIVLVA